MDDARHLHVQSVDDCARALGNAVTDGGFRPDGTFVPWPAHDSNAPLKDQSARAHVNIAAAGAAASSVLPHEVPTMRPAREPPLPLDAYDDRVSGDDF